MATERRQHRTPFTVTSKTLLDSGGEIVAVFNNSDVAGFVARACNRYDALLAIYDLCRGRHDNLTAPYTSLHDRAFDALARAFDDDISKNGR